MKIKIMLPFLLLCGFSTIANAQQQGKTQFNIGYTAAFPASSFKEQLSEKSLRGFRAGVMHGLSNNFSIGFGTGYQDFYQKTPRGMYKLQDGSDLSAVRTHSIQTIPLLILGRYSFAPGKSIQPYVALGAGGNLISYLDLLGEFVNEEKAKFGFAARPELGLQIPFGKTKESAFNIGASYNFMPVKIGSFENLNHIGLHVGVNIPLRK